jgi:hypothetical protein
MPRMVNTAEALRLDDDPRPMDVVRWQRFRVMVEEEAVKDTWGCWLYIASRPGGWLKKEHREAGDRYQQLTMDHFAAQGTDPDELDESQHQLAYARINKRKKAWREANEALGLSRNLVMAFVLDDTPMVTEKERTVVRDGLQLLSNLFSKGRTKRVRNVV